MLSGFSREQVYVHITLCKHAVYYQVRLFRRICLPKSTSTPFNHLFRQMAGLSLLRLHIAQLSSNGILTVSSIGIAVRLSLRPRLTLVRLALSRKPWACGDGVCTPFVVTYAYIFFSRRSSISHNTPSTPTGMLPYHSLKESFASAAVLMPVNYPRVIARLVSCYALFK